MKKSKKIFAIIALIALIVLVATGVTFSRFYQSVKGNASVKLTTWIFNATTNGGKPLSQISLEGANGETIHPGSSGSFEIKIDSTGSGVNIAYHGVVTNENLPESMFFYMQGIPEVRYQDLTDLVIDSINGTLTADAPTATYTICWEWPINGQDVIDNSSSNSYGFDIEVIGEQQ